jgi:hypothetical protein
VNFVFISPQFPSTYWQFCDRLSRRGVTVLGIGDTPFDQLAREVKGALTEYYWVPSLENYDEVSRAVAFLMWKYGRIDWIESNNEHWLALDARLRSDFNVTTGPDSYEMEVLQSKAAMKVFYARAGIPSARQTSLTDLDAALRFANGEGGVGWPLIAKPERGVGSGGVRRLDDAGALEQFLSTWDGSSYLLEQCVSGEIVSYDAIVDSHGTPLYEGMEAFPPSMLDVARDRLDLSYLSLPTVDPNLARIGRRAIKSFGLRSRFVHMEFFRLDRDIAGLGREGDYVGLEVNVRPPGGPSPDMMNFAHSCDVYDIWASMVTQDSCGAGGAGVVGEPFYCVYAARRADKSYRHAHEEVFSAYGAAVVMSGGVPGALADEMGDYMYIARFSDEATARGFARFVQETAY